MKDCEWRLVFRIMSVALALFVVSSVGSAQGKVSPPKATGTAPSVTDVKIIETAPSPAQAYFSFKISDADGDVDLATGSPIKAGVFCPMAGFAADSWGKAETQDKQLGVAHYRASYAPHRGVGECSFDLSVKNKAGNKSALVKAKINFK